MMIHLCTAGPSSVSIQQLLQKSHVSSLSRADIFCTDVCVTPPASQAMSSDQILLAFRVNKRGEAMLTNMNMVVHEHYEGIFY